MSYLRDRRNAFVYAFRGLGQAFSREPHMRLHTLAALLAAGAGLYFSISRMEWLAVLSAICLVMVTELFNTAIERTCDRITREQEESIGYIKDICSAAVLLSAIYALCTGWLVFGTRIV